MRTVNARELIAAVASSMEFGLALLWCMLVSHTLGFSATLGSEMPVNSRLYYLSGILTLALFYVAFPRLSERSDGLLKFAVPFLAVAGTLSYGLSYRQSFLPPEILSICGLFSIGLCFFWFLARSVVVFSRLWGFAKSVWVVSFGIALKVLLVPLIGAVSSPQVQMAIALILPFVVVGLGEVPTRMLRALLDECADLPYEAPSAPTSKMFKCSVAALLVVSAVLLGVIRSVSDLGLWGGDAAQVSWVATLVSAVAVIAFAAVLLVPMESWSIVFRFQPAILLVLLGLFVVVLQAQGEGAALVAEVVRIDELCAHGLYWSVVVAALGAVRVPSYRVVGAAEAMFAAVSIAWLLWLRSSALMSNVYVLLAAYGAVVVVIVVTWQSGKSRSANEEITASEGDPSVSPLARSVADACMELAASYGLSPRETEVFVLLAQGRTRAFIQDQLVLSGSTVKTHVGHIYAKLGVDGRQEMMDVIWGQRP